MAYTDIYANNFENLSWFPLTNCSMKLMCSINKYWFKHLFQKDCVFKFYAYVKWLIDKQVTCTENKN